MDSTYAKESHPADQAADDEDDIGSDEGSGRNTGGRRLRFCNERQQTPTTTSGTETPQIKKARLDSQAGRYARHSYPTRRRNLDTTKQPARKPYYVIPPQRTHPSHRAKISSPNATTYFRPSSSTNDLKPKDTIIHINPKFIKRFIEKSIQLNSLNATTSCQKQEQSQEELTATQMPQAIKSLAKDKQSSSSKYDFQDCSTESLQAAATMSVIRLVTECIEDDQKRDEKCNKLLAKRLIDQLTTKSVVEPQVETKAACENLNSEPTATAAAHEKKAEQLDSNVLNDSRD